KWSYETGGAVVSSPAVDVDGSVYVGSKDGYLYALTRSGALKWRFQTDAAIYASPALAQDGTVYVGSLDGKLYALGRDGELLWSYSTGDRIYSSAVIGYQGEIIFGSNDFSVYALNPDGSLKWSYATGGEVIASPAIDQDGTVYVPSNDWNFYAFQPDGSLKWSYPLQMPVWSSPTISMEGNIFDGTCGAARQYGDSSIPEGQYPLTGTTLLQAFELMSSGDAIRFTVSGGSGDEHGSYAEGYTGTFVTAVSGRSMLLLDDGINPGGGTTSGSPTHGFEGHTSWPRFRHDSRNTGNVNTSLEIPKFDLGFQIVYSTCDIDRDGAVTMFDAIALLRGIQRGQYSFGMDRDNDGAVNFVDVIRFLLDMRDGTCNLGSPISLASAENQKGLEELQSLATLNKAELEQALATMDLSDEDRQAVGMMLNGLAPGAALPKAFSLAQNSPNPFNPSTTIAYEVPEGANQTVQLSVFDVRGRKVRQLVDGMAEPGKHFAFFDGRDDLGRELPSGVYFYRLSAGSFSQTRKMILLK
ncbi:PQQ-binding-like beta-propeller repeat protein, partial [bacterium]|nr:PQQ-binding-like beta-propeller repeat protein [bacterium]